MFEYEEVMGSEAAEEDLWRSIVRKLPGRILECQVETGCINPVAVAVGDFVTSVVNGRDKVWTLHNGEIKSLDPLEIEIVAKKVTGFVELASALKGLGDPTSRDEEWLGVDAHEAIGEMIRRNFKGVLVGSFEDCGLTGVFRAAHWLRHGGPDDWELVTGPDPDDGSGDWEGWGGPWGFLRDGDFSREWNTVFSASDGSVRDELEEAGLGFDEVVGIVRKHDKAMARDLERCGELG